MSGGSFTALVLAGSRGPGDPVALHAGRSHKAEVPVAGVPMLVRVVRTLERAPAVGRIALCVGDRGLIDGLPELAQRVNAGTVALTPAGTTPSDSVRRALDAIDRPFPLLVTTADHPLLTVSMVEEFCAAAAQSDVDVAIGVAPTSAVRAAYPEAVRTYYRFAGEGYSGCNLFAFKRPAAVRAAEFWSAMERHRKRPWRLVAAIGPSTLLRYLLGRLTLDTALALLSRRMGATLGAVVLTSADAAIDVDKPADLELAETILKRRAGV